MPANLPPQFFELNERLRNAKRIEEKIEILKSMLAICPKHKGTERVQEEIKKKIAKLKKALPKRIKKEEVYFVKKEGAGQVVVLGFPNVGKTSLINILCNTNLKVADYPFTTQFPMPAMMRYENILIQMVDTPPLLPDFRPGWLKNLTRNADGILVLVDLSQDSHSQIQEITKILNEWEIPNEKIFWVAKKIDGQNLKNLTQKMGNDSQVFVFNETNDLDLLKQKIFELLKIIRVFLKDPKKNDVDFENPLIMKRGTKLNELLDKINEEWAGKFKGAKRYKKNLEQFEIVGRDYLLQDGDVLEIKF